MGKEGGFIRFKGQDEMLASTDAVAHQVSVGGWCGRHIEVGDELAARGSIGVSGHQDVASEGWTEQLFMKRT